MATSETLNWVDFYSNNKIEHSFIETPQVNYAPAPIIAPIKYESSNVALFSGQSSLLCKSIEFLLGLIMGYGIVDFLIFT